VLDNSFDEFVHGHIVALDRYALALTGDRHAADDLVQETLVRVAGAWRRITRDGNPAGYATTVMFRTHISLWRRRRRHPTNELTVDPASPIDAFAPVEARLTLRLALRKLPRLQHAVLVATYLRDHADNEIAEMIGRSPATVRSLRHRGLKALHLALGIEPVEPTQTPAVTAIRSATPGDRDLAGHVEMNADVTTVNAAPAVNAAATNAKEVSNGEPGISVA
jgi:RNA polymerase sigma-70 factor (sigma-E family)